MVWVITVKTLTTKGAACAHVRSLLCAAARDWRARCEVTA